MNSPNEFRLAFTGRKLIDNIMRVIGNLERDLGESREAEAIADKLNDGGYVSLRRTPSFVIESRIAGLKLVADALIPDETYNLSITDLTMLDLFTVHFQRL